MEKRVGGCPMCARARARACVCVEGRLVQCSLNYCGDYLISDLVWLDVFVTCNED